MTTAATGPVAAPFVSRALSVEKDWIDYNGHMNMAYYNVLFDRSADEAFAQFGIGPHYVKERSLTVYTAECHVRYVREVHLGDQVTCRFQLLENDEKRLRVCQEMFHTDGWLAATAEVLVLHIDMSGPKVAPFPADILARIEAMREAHAALPVPEYAGHGIALRRKRS